MASYETIVDAIQQAERGANPAWKEEALDAVHQLAVAFDTFTADDLWAIIDEPRNASALGPVMLRARREGWIASTGRTVQSHRETNHRTVTVWKSLL